MAKIPILSICIPAYYRLVWFRQALESIADGNKQYESLVEVVVTDDSDQRDCEVIAQDVFRGWSGSWQYEFHESRLGMVENWNRGINLATGQYVLVLHDDDYLLSGGLGRLLEAIAKSQDAYAVLLFGVEVVDAEGKVMKRQVYEHDHFLQPREALLRLLSVSSFVRFPAIVIRRSLFSEVGLFRAEWQEPCDVDMWIRLFARHGVFCSQSVTAAYRVHSQALTMGVFNERVIDLLLGLFKEVSQFSVLSPEELEHCKSLFLYQFILAGAWRQLRRKEWREFKKVMGLFDLVEIKNLDCPRKWLLLKIGFSLISFLLFLNKS